MHVKPVFSLVENRGPQAFEHLPGDLLPPVSGQAVEHYRVRGRTCQKLRIYLVMAKGFHSLVGLTLPAHASPDVGVEHIGVRYGFSWIGDQFDLCFCLVRGPV